MNMFFSIGYFVFGILFSFNAGAMFTRGEYVDSILFFTLGTFSLYKGFRYMALKA